MKSTIITGPKGQIEIVRGGTRHYGYAFKSNIPGYPTDRCWAWYKRKRDAVKRARELV